MSQRAAARRTVERIFRAGLDAVEAGAAVQRAIVCDDAGLRILGSPVESGRRVIVLAAGKAAAPMARAVEAIVGDRIRGGLVITKDQHAAGWVPERLVLLEAAHPVPDARSEAAAHAALRLVRDADRGDLLLVLLSGGATALLAAPTRDLSLADLAETHRLLLESGADIGEMNAVRKHLSLLSGGRLAAATRAERIEVLAISDVIGDREDVIGSGPCSPDPTRFSDALAILDRRGLVDRVPDRVRRALEAGASGDAPETLAPGDPALRRVRYHVIANNRDACAAAAEAAREEGFDVHVVDEPICGEARDVARRLVEEARRLAGARPACLIAGGETTVDVRGGGLGGRNQELALAGALALDAGASPGAEEPELVLLAAGTDGSDGPTAAAGAWADPGTCARATALGLNAEASLSANDSHRFFSAEGGLFETGPTGTNVMDLVVVWIGRAGLRGDPRVRESVASQNSGLAE